VAVSGVDDVRASRAIAEVEAESITSEVVAESYSMIPEVAVEPL
jgi:hypothetical protein